MFTPRHVLIGLTFLVAVASVIAGDRDVERQESRELTKYLQNIHEAYEGERLKTWVDAYLKFIEQGDLKAWQKRVADEQDEKRRKSFLAEYFAYSGHYELLRAEGFNVKPITTSKHRLQIILFQPGRPSDGGKPLSKELRATTYLIIRRDVPVDRSNPFTIMLSKAYRGYTTQQLQKVVESYRKQW